MVEISFVEFETAADLETAVSKLDQREFKDRVVSCVANVSWWNTLRASQRSQTSGMLICLET